MKKIKPFIFSLFSIIAFSAKTYACNPNKSCMQGGPGYPCPTCSEPFRMCLSEIENPICVTERLACNTNLTICVTGLLIGSSSGASCAACLIGVWGTAGATTAACVSACGLTAAAIEQIVQRCEN